MKKVLSVFSLALLLCWWSQPVLAQEAKEVSPVLTATGSTQPQKAIWDVLFNYDLQTVTGGLGNAGAVYLPAQNQFWVSRWSTPAGRIYVINTSGVAVDSFTTTFTGTRNMCFDGQHVVHAINTNILQKVDPATRTSAGTITMPSSITARFISYDPTADGGNGGYWVGNWNAGALNYYLVSKTGAQLAVIANTAITGTYGIAFDKWSPGGPFLWVWSQGSGAGFPQKIIQLSIATGQPTGVEHDVITDIGVGNAQAIAGGMFITDKLVSGKVVLGGCMQGTPDRLFGYELMNLDAGPLAAFNLTAPAAGTVITSFPNSATQVTITWDTSRAGATYKWIFGSPVVPPRILTMPVAANQLKLTLGQIDNLLAANGVLPGQEVVGQWDVWAFRGNSPTFDSLKATNGPRAITLKRGVPQLLPFSLLEPANNTTITTSAFNNTPVNIKWTRSGEGTKYKWKFGPTVNQPILVVPSANGGYDTSLSFINSALDLILQNGGIQPGQSLAGQWSVWAFNGADSVKATQTFNLTLTRQAKGDVLVAYDSSATNGRISKDSCAAVLGQRGVTFDLFNKGTQTGTNVISFRGYKKVIWLGEGTSVMSVVQKDSIKAYLSNPTPGQKSKLIIFAEDIGYQFGRTGSTYLDLDFLNNWLGANYVADRPTSGAAQRLLGVEVNPTIPDSTIGTWPDVLSQFDPLTSKILYKFTSQDAANSIGKQTQNYNVAVMAHDLESLRRAFDSPPASAQFRVMDGAFQFVDGNVVIDTFVTVTAPNGGEQLTVGAQTNITWNQYGLTNVKLEYTTDNGTSWNVIAASVPALVQKNRDRSTAARANAMEYDMPLGSYNWTVPNTPSTNCKVRVTSVERPAITDMSNAVFTIKVGTPSSVKFEEKFNISNQPAALEARGWKWVNQDGGGLTAVFNGNTTVFTAFEGPDTGYAAQNFNGAVGMYINQWLISPQINAANGDSLTFWWRSTASAFNDSVKILVSPTGDTALASFTQVVGYYNLPKTGWTYWSKALNFTGNVRFAFQYLHYNGGSAGAHSDYWGLDWLRWVGQGGTPAPITWQTPILVKDAGTTASGTITMGQGPNATNGIDAALGEQSLPPAPPAGVFDARFILPVTPPDASLKDYRNDTLKSIDWTLNFQPGAAGYPMNFTWDPATLPVGSFTLKDAITGTVVNVNMKTQNSYQLTNTGITSLKIEYRKAAAGSIPLNAGWNIVGVPLVAPNMAVATLFPAATSPAYGYNNGYVTADPLTVDKGYWIRYPNAANITVNGNPVTATTVPLVQGWNLVTVHMSPCAVSSITTTPTGLINSPFYGYAAGYTTPTTLEPGKGYWVRSTAAGVMNLPANLAKNGDEAVEVKIDKDWAKITVADADGNASTLYNAVQVSNLSQYELPPAPPAGIFDVRFNTQRNVEALGTDAKDIVISGATYPVTISVSGMDVRIRDKATGGQIVNELVRANGSVTVSNSGVNVLEVQTTEIPVEYALYQNYPNPFNPSTTIKFGLPEKANVALNIYNQLGEKVATLVNGELEAGYHQLNWNASNLTSGIYFYEIKTEKFSSVKKLMLVK